MNSPTPLESKPPIVFPHRPRTSPSSNRLVARRVGNVGHARMPMRRSHRGRAGEQAPARTADEHRVGMQSGGVKGVIAPDPAPAEPNDPDEDNF